MEGSGKYSKMQSRQKQYSITIIKSNNMQGNDIPVITQVLTEPGVEAQYIRVIGLFYAQLDCSGPAYSLALSDKYLLLLQAPHVLAPVFACPLNFDLKFQVVRELPWKDEYTPGRPVGIKFEKELANKSFETLEVYSNDVGLLLTWKTMLEARLNQRSFHSLFKAKKQIGKGAFATVYLAQRLEDKKLVAVKAFSKQRQYSGEQGKQSLVNQINLIRKFNHPNIIKIQGVFETENSIYVILELVEGRQLYDRLKNNQVKTQKDVMEIIRNILSALKALAQKRVIHRDLKPQNIMFRKEGANDLVICDFGLATFAEEEKYLFVRCGTPGFVAPEIINIRDMTTKSDPISDVFSAGLIFHYLAFGRSIFDGKKYQQILTQNRACIFNFDKELYKNADSLTIDLLNRLLDVNPKTRISASDALKHPYFDVSRLEQKLIPRPDLTEMIDEKDQDATTLARSRRGLLKEQINIQNVQVKSRRNSYRGSLYCEKENQAYQIPLSKKSSLANQLETRKSKRSSGTQKRTYYNSRRA